jgi:hypothetical protein
MASSREKAGKNGMDILIWINTLAILFVFAGGGIIVNIQLRKTNEALARIEETAARGERLSLAILEPLPVPSDLQP